MTVRPDLVYKGGMDWDWWGQAGVWTGFGLVMLVVVAWVVRADRSFRRRKKREADACAAINTAIQRYGVEDDRDRRRQSNQRFRDQATRQFSPEWLVASPTHVLGADVGDSIVQIGSRYYLLKADLSQEPTQFHQFDYMQTTGKLRPIGPWHASAPPDGIPDGLDDDPDHAPVTFETVFHVRELPQADPNPDEPRAWYEHLAEDDDDALV